MPRHEYSVVRGRPSSHRRPSSSDGYGYFGPLQHELQSGNMQPGYMQPGYMQPGFTQPGYPQSGYFVPQPILHEGDTISTNAGVPYPVAERDLANLQDESIDRHSSRWRTYPSPISRDKALRLLNEGLRMTNEHTQAVERLNTFLYQMGYPGIDLPIKVFNDLDFLFFQGSLKNRVTLVWSKYSVSRTREPFGSAYGLTWPAGSNGNARVNIRLNSTCDWGDLGGMRECIFTLLHEMIHAWYMVQCGRHDEGPDPSTEITTGLLDKHHGYYFHSAKEAVNNIIQTLRGLGMSRGRVGERC
ncbi:hypothetical protein LTR56_004232 [Elasticomyces elasticus]|nr:hypothetical protein LTR56_004232 [Elasticomyces elasticus]KAK3655121.1 hypothetical protein LTR22_010431 [Elasticomyces elasticus]KAK4907706.1 hypothetical protein LTR49_023302 [Elasticomyces elasticus]KAK5750570.1 hypothetical protein LTS12_019360 [Elasticomyces elasticus]